MGLKLFVRVMLLVLVLALAGPFFIKGPDGQPLLTLDDVKRTTSRTVASVKNTLRGVRNDAARAAGDEQAGKVEMQRWQDANGQWHYSNDGPAMDNAETIYVDPDVNLMDPVNAPRVRAKKPASTPTPAAPGLVTPGRALDIIEDATSAKQDLEKRNEEMKKRLDDMR